MDRTSTAPDFAPTAWDVSFDVFQRYAAVAHLITAMSSKQPGGSMTVLDVGSGRTPFIARFLPESGHKLFFLDKEVPTMSPEGRSGRFVVGNGLSLPFTSGSFDCICCVDVLEHLSAGDRHQALDEMVRVSRGKLVIAAPCSEDGVRFEEQVANSLFKAYFETGHPRLDEHLSEPLPSRAELRDYVTGKHGLQGQVFSNAYLPRWQRMIVFSLALYRIPELREFASLVNRYYNENLYPYDNKAPAYRRIFVFGAEEPLSLPCTPEDADFHRHYEQVQSHLDMGHQLLTMMMGSRIPSARLIEESKRDKQRLERQLEQTLRARKEELAGAAAEVGELTRERQRLERELAQMRLAREQDTAKAAAEIRGLTQEKQRLGRELAQAEATQAAVQSEVERLLAEIEHYQSRLDKSAQMIARTKAERDEARNRVAELESRQIAGEARQHRKHSGP